MIRGRGALLFGLTALALVLAMAGASFACVNFAGKVTVDGDDGDTVVVGLGNDHGYCSTGRPTTAAAGELGDTITIDVEGGTCSDAGASATHQLPDGTYQVRFNNSSSYVLADPLGTPRWNPINGTGCWASTTWVSVLGTFSVDTNGDGSWSGSLDMADLVGPPQFSTPVTASNLCIGEASPAGPTRMGMLIPYRLLVV